MKSSTSRLSFCFVNRQRGKAFLRIMSPAFLFYLCRLIYPVMSRRSTCSIKSVLSRRSTRLICSVKFVH
ncbi:hypothetical protein TELCIR_20366 [Teladorsagia circumcincta]|uniref:Uncharacterized protein n=1 Tax=Teladorsagia circumcincta TaxID=45464 RepID=A0A2G9TJP7_TELCI|nr:hypothetical protein TELCIR_20366 [Teladorsagia circumcincta]